MKCEVCGSKKLKTKTKNNKYGKILCCRHYKQLSRHGKILERTIYDPNKIVCGEKYCSIELYDKQGRVRDRVLIDREMKSIAEQYKWTWNSGYARAIKEDVYLHNLVKINREDGKVVDHINRNKLDNRKENLRLITQQENWINISIPKDNESGFIGVFFDKERGKWRAELSHEGRAYTKRFDTKEEAIIYRLTKEKEGFGGKIAPQRHLFEKYL